MYFFATRHQVAKSHKEYAIKDKHFVNLSVFVLVAILFLLTFQSGLIIYKAGLIYGVIVLMPVLNNWVNANTHEYLF